MLENDSDSREKEVAVFCPVCCAFETVYICDGKIETGHRWYIENSKIYHSECGAICRIFSESGWGKPGVLSNPIYGDKENSNKFRTSRLITEDENSDERQKNLDK